MAQMARREVLAVVAALLGVAWELPGAGAFAPGAAGPALLGGEAASSLKFTDLDGAPGFLGELDGAFPPKSLIRLRTPFAFLFRDSQTFSL